MSSMVDEQQHIEPQYDHGDYQQQHDDQMYPQEDQQQHYDDGTQQEQYEPQYEDQQQQQHEQVYDDAPVEQQHYEDEQQHIVQDAAPQDEELFSQLQHRDPGELLNYITEGDVFTIFFPTTNDPNDPTSQAIPLYVFYDPEIAGVCWCEPGNRYISPDQTLPIQSVTELHLGTSAIHFPQDSEEGRCFSIVSDLITLHCEAAQHEKRDEFLLALYWLIQQVSLPNEAVEEQGGTTYK